MRSAPLSALRVRLRSSADLITGAHRSKLAHLENSAFKVRELIDGAVVRLVWCPTDENAADIFTKSLGTRKFKKFQAFLLGLPQDGEFKALICRMLFM